MKNKLKRFVASTLVVSVASVERLMADGGNNLTASQKQALDGVTENVKVYFDGACNLFYIVCAIMALIGAFRIYSKWSSGDPDTVKSAAGWVGSLIFAVVVITLIKSFFIPGT